MAKNYQQAGLTIPVTNKTDKVLKSGSPVVLGDRIAVAITDIAKDKTGDGFAQGVFRLPKLTTEAIPVGKKVYLKAGTLQLTEADAVFAGYAWESAEKTATTVAVNING
ncbi:recombinase RecA [Sodalis sp. TME1]|nr:recombinase RecA [Sodalis sp. TME1]